MRSSKPFIVAANRSSSAARACAEMRWSGRVPGMAATSRRMRSTGDSERPTTNQIPATASSVSSGSPTHNPATSAATDFSAARSDDAA